MSDAFAPFTKNGFIKFKYDLQRIGYPHSSAFDCAYFPSLATDSDAFTDGTDPKIMDNVQTKFMALSKRLQTDGYQYVAEDKTGSLNAVVQRHESDRL